MSMLSRLRTVFSFKIISDPSIILFMPIIVSVRQWGYSGFIYNEIWSIKFLTARAEFTWFSQGGNIGGQRSSQSRLRRVQQCNGSAQCRPVAGSYFISEHTRHCTRGSLPVSTALSMFGCKINHLYTSTQPPTLKLSFFCIPQVKVSFRNGCKCNQLGLLATGRSCLFERLLSWRSFA